MLSALGRLAGAVRFRRGTRYARGVTARFEPLAAGEPVGVFALSGPVDLERLEEGLAILRSWGHPVVEASNVRLRGPGGYLAGTDAERIGGLMELVDGGVRVAMAARGGYGVLRLARWIPFDRLAAAGVRLIGFSDLTPVLCRLAAAGVPQLHGPVVTSLAWDAESTRGLADLVTGVKGAGDVLLELPRESVLRPGKASGPLLGGNLTLLAASVGTPLETPLAGSVLVLEDINEPVYRIDRLLTQLRLSGRLDGVKALIFGDLSEFGTSDRERLHELLLEAVPHGPVVAGLPFGHGRRNVPLPLGGGVSLDTVRGMLRWEA